MVLSTASRIINYFVKIAFTQITIHEKESIPLWKASPAYNVMKLKMYSAYGTKSLKVGIEAIWNVQLYVSNRFAAEFSKTLVEHTGRIKCIQYDSKAVARGACDSTEGI